MNHDLGGKYVLVSDNFIYYGKDTIKIEGSLNELVVGRAIGAISHRMQSRTWKTISMGEVSISKREQFWRIHIYGGLDENCLKS